MAVILSNLPPFYLSGGLKTDMVSIRRRKLLGMCAGRNSLLAPLPWVNTPQNFAENTKPVSVHPLPLNDSFNPKEVSCDVLELIRIFKFYSCDSLCFFDMISRKRHRRKHVDNQEPCIMRGVYFKNLKWQAAIKVDKKQIHLGTVGSQEEAARLYDSKMICSKLSGQHSCVEGAQLELSEEEKQELRKFNWDEFLAMTRSAITNKKSQRRSGTASRRKHEDNDWEGEQGLNGFSASDDDTLAP
ncbi:hypothetical protein DH2020_000572 [Rehmannia glutinosa]|uniref:Ethylene-responsive transcription factor-like protein n=1 Tax=Rehmannia glutinosa TaxID=99300 RepID=A0ABR0XXB5_REHGL